MSNAPENTHAEGLHLGIVETHDWNSRLDNKIDGVYKGRDCAVGGRLSKGCDEGGAAAGGGEVQEGCGRLGDCGCFLGDGTERARAWCENWNVVGKWGTPEQVGLFERLENSEKL